jgi:hypothetical protein
MSQCRQGAVNNNGSIVSIWLRHWAVVSASRDVIPTGTLSLADGIELNLPAPEESWRMGKLPWERLSVKTVDQACLVN